VRLQFSLFHLTHRSYVLLYSITRCLQRLLTLFHPLLRLSRRDAITMRNNSSPGYVNPGSANSLSLYRLYYSYSPRPRKKHLIGLVVDYDRWKFRKPTVHREAPVVIRTIISFWYIPNTSPGLRVTGAPPGPDLITIWPRQLTHAQRVVAMRAILFTSAKQRERRPAPLKSGARNNSITQFSSTAHRTAPRNDHERQPSPLISIEPLL